MNLITTGHTMFSFFKNKNNTKKHVVFLTGAGLSAPSGLSTFRDSDGLWENHAIDKFCNIHEWKNNFSLVHQFYNQRRLELDIVKPTQGHFLLSNIQKQFPTQVTLFTQNVDDLLERTGAKDVIHLHGFLTELKCLNCKHVFDIGHTEWNETESCPHCHKKTLIKPNVIFFGEQAKHYKTLHEFFKIVYNPDVLFVVIGTSGNVIKTNDLFRQASCKRILCNMHDSINDESLFDKVYKNSIEIAAKDIEYYIHNFLKINKRKR
jgi:NAD-dependent deacetylase